MINPLLKVIRIIFPGLGTRLRRYWRNFRYIRLIKKYVRINGSVVKYGPFAGMRYIEKARCSKLLPKLIGSYEMELHPIINKLLNTRFELVIDVGCAEGYYAVGFAVKGYADLIVAFDIDNTSRCLCQELAILNNVEQRLIIGGKCTCELLNIFKSNNCLVICDCEGYEYELLDPKKAELLQNSHILVEIHEWQNPEIPSIIHKRFKYSHDFIYVPIEQRKPDEFDHLNIFTKKEQLLAINEERMFDYNQKRYEWIILKPKS